MTTIYTSAEKLAALPKRHDFDFYPTPRELCDSALNWIVTNPKSNVLDPGAGTGVWGQAVKAQYPSATITGIDIRPLPKPQDYSFWFQADFKKVKPEPVFDCVIGNPPFKHAEAFVRLGMSWLARGGQLLFLLRLNFLESQNRYAGLFAEYQPKRVVISSRRVSFTGDGKTNATAYALFIWEKGWAHGTTLDWFDYLSDEKQLLLQGVA